MKSENLNMPDLDNIDHNNLWKDKLKFLSNSDLNGNIGKRKRFASVNVTSSNAKNVSPRLVGSLKDQKTLNNIDNNDTINMYDYIEEREEEEMDEIAVAVDHDA